jgi:hypothetical protein
MQIEANHKCKVGETMARNPDETKFQLQRDRLLKNIDVFTGTLTPSASVDFDRIA